MGFMIWCAIVALIIASGQVWLWGVLFCVVIAGMCLGMLNGGLNHRDNGGGSGSRSDGYDDYNW